MNTVWMDIYVMIQLSLIQVIEMSTMWPSEVLPVRGFGVPTPKEVPEGTWRGDLCVPGVEHHADVFGNNSRLDAMVQL